MPVNSAVARCAAVQLTPPFALLTCAAGSALRITSYSHVQSLDSALQTPARHDVDRPVFPLSPLGPLAEASCCSSCRFHLPCTPRPLGLLQLELPPAASSRVAHGARCSLTEAVHCMRALTADTADTADPDPPPRADPRTLSTPGGSGRRRPARPENCSHAATQLHDANEIL